MRDVNGLKVWCTNKDRGCQWSGELGYFADEHLNPISGKGGCEYEDVPCTIGCGVQIQRHLLEDHEVDFCPQRSYSCVHCGDYSSTHVDVVHNHFPKCASYPIACPNGCKVGTLPREEMNRHMEADCPLQPIKCDFHYVGCDAKLQRGRTEEHMKKSWQMHISLLAAANLMLHRKLEGRDEQIQQLTAAVEDKGHQLSALSKEVSALKQYCDSMQAHLTPVPPFDFTIPNVAILKKNDMIFLSPPFYSHVRGYKLRLRIRVNGWAQRVGFMSVYLFQMRGEYDDTLEWPFKGSVTIELVNTERKAGNKDITLDCADVADVHSPFRRQTEYEMPDWGYGVEEFISHQELFNVATSKHPFATSEYVLNDCVHFRVTKVEF